MRAIHWITRGARRRLSVLALLLGVLGLTAWWTMIRMPLHSYHGPLPQLTTVEEELRDNLRQLVTVLAGDIGERNVFLPGRLAAAADWIESVFMDLMVTDTAPFRYPHYHHASDTPDQIDYDRLARVTVGLNKVIQSLASP